MNRVIHLKNARKTYHMGNHAVHALDGVNIDIARGEFVSIIGSSGSGKSTLMHMLGCLDHLSEGTYELAGEDMSKATDAELSTIRNRKIGFVFQQFNLLANLTVLENIALPLAYAGVPRAQRLDLAAKMAQKVGLEARLDHRPNELSGGQCQRVAIARALINEPDVLFADEPTGALDSKTGVEIMALLDDLHAQGLTILLVTHDLKIAEHAQRKITLSDGKIVEDKQQRDKAEKSMENTLQGQSSKLGFKDMFRIGLREGLLAHKLRTALTMLGVLIGVASVIAMSSFSEGSKKKQADQIRALGSNLIKIIDRKLENQPLFQARASGSAGLTREDGAILKNAIKEISAIAFLREMVLDVEIDRTPQPKAQVRAVYGDYLKVNNLSLARGKNFQESDYLRNQRVAILGAGLIGKQTDEQTLINTQIRIGGQPYRVIGVLANRFVDTTELEAVGANDSNYDILIPLSTAINRYTYLPLRSELDEIQLQLSEEELLASAGKSIRRILDARHRGVTDYELVIPLDLLKSKQESQKLLDILSLSISAISLVVGGIGIMNIMLASVTERMKEIGIRRAVGARKEDIRNQFLVESVLISMAGGIAGVLLAMGGVTLASSPLDFPVVFSPALMLVAFAAAFLTGLGFGAYPAIRASSENLVDILSRE
ncbi:ATP-binding cassette domain-containing protein [Kiritimatiellaeota bacterium B1221]|nr:ATP-binding cassette domain-containing protein [Kiritimatiellaeota bacterium B1221]